VFRSRQWSLGIILVLRVILACLAFDRVGGGSNPIRDAFSYVLTPLQFVLKHVTEPVFKFSQNLGHLSSLAEENRALRRENAYLRSQLTLLQEAQIENENLRRQLNFKSAVPNFQLLSAEVIGHDPSNWLRYLIIDRGADDGIRESMPVLTDAGLVGRISEVGARSAKVMLLTNPSSSVSALVQRTRATGVVQGTAQNALVMLYVPPGDLVKPGDVVLTSGLGGHFPRRLVIGQVAEVSYRDVDMFQQVRITPAVNLRDLEMVMVLLNFSPLDTPAISGTSPDMDSQERR